MDAITAVDQYKEKLRAAGIIPGKPLYDVLLMAYEATLETRAIVGRGARGLTPEGEQELIYRVSENAATVTAQEVERLSRRVGWRNSFLMALIGLALLAVGYGWGRWSAPALDDFLAMVSNENDLSTLENYCRQHTFLRDGKTACQLPPVWVRGMPQ